MVVDDKSTVPLATLDVKVWLRGAQMADPNLTERAADVPARRQRASPFGRRDRVPRTGKADDQGPPDERDVRWLNRSGELAADQQRRGLLQAALPSSQSQDLELVQQVTERIGCSREKEVIWARSRSYSEKPCSPTPRNPQLRLCCLRTASFPSWEEGPCSGRRPCRRTSAWWWRSAAPQSIWLSPPTCPSVFCRSRRTLILSSACTRRSCSGSRRKGRSSCSKSRGQANAGRQRQRQPQRRRQPRRQPQRQPRRQRRRQRRRRRRRQANANGRVRPLAAPQLTDPSKA